MGSPEYVRRQLDEWFQDEQSTKVVQALQAHADALITSGKSSERYTRQMVIATWVMAAATVALLVAALAQLIVTFQPTK